MKYNEEYFKTKKEDQMYDRKSAKVKAVDIARHLVAFANSDGGTIAVGVEDDYSITGVSGYTNNVNDILTAGFRFCNPSIVIDKEYIDVVDGDGKPNKVLLIKIPQSQYVHATNKDEVYKRCGD